VVLSEHYSGVALPGLSRRSRVAARVAYAGADLVCPVSGALAARMPCSGPMRVVGNAVDTSVFFPSGSPPLRRIVAVGGLVPVKGFDVLVSVAARLPEDLEVVIAGDGPERGRLSALGGGRVSFVGRLSRPDVASLLRSASVAVVPSRWETQGVAALEALCCGVPVVASAAGGLPEVVGPGDGLLVPPGQPAALAAALLRAVETDWDRPAIAARAAARHGYEAIGARWRAIYEEVAGG
jgi:glycosyltransferase involved in cell wall biosynthesis